MVSGEAVARCPRAAALYQPSTLQGCSWAVLDTCSALALLLYRTTKALSDKLFQQLDFDHSGGISFKEFLIGLERMIMEDYEDDDEEEQGQKLSKAA